MQTHDLQLLLADVIEGLMATDRRVNSLTVSLLAMRSAFQEIDKTGQFEKIYAKHYEAEAAELSSRSSSDDVQLLLEVTKRLRSER